MRETLSQADYWLTCGMLFARMNGSMRVDKTNPIETEHFSTTQI
jgi:hypothetical protein